MKNLALSDAELDRIIREGACQVATDPLNRRAEARPRPAATKASVPTMPTVPDVPRRAPEQRTKYGNKRTEGPDPGGGTRLYASKREAKHAAWLMEEKRAGRIADFYPQVSLCIGPDERMRDVRAVIDFLVIEKWLPGGRFVARVVDPKGADSLHSRAKRAALRGRGLQVELV